MMQLEITSASHLVTVPGLDDLEADLGLADSLPVPMLADRARRAARLAADLQTALIARAVSREASPEPDRLLAVAKVAEMLEFTEEYVYELIRRGHLPAVRSGKYVRVSASAVDSFIKNGPRDGVDSAVYHRVNAIAWTVFDKAVDGGRADPDVLPRTDGWQMTAADELVNVLLRELEDLRDLRNREQPIRLR